jgi:uncharacterized protein YbbC (DUF1343 family)
MAVQTGFDHLVNERFESWRGRRVAIVCNQASVSSDLEHLLFAAQRFQADAGFEIICAFGPQHGIWGHTQDNMIEWEGYRDDVTGITFYSLYGSHREPTPEMLAGVDLLVFDVQDVGARYYTFVWTLFYCMKQCEQLGIEIQILDRPNPVGGVHVEGALVDEGWESFVGLAPLPMRHGMTVGEVANYFQSRYYPGINHLVKQMSSWSRDMLFPETGLPWVIPSPNMPSPDTALVYPGMCLIEGTKMSEGRGTTKPFEMFGAPYLKEHAFTDELNQLGLPGAKFRPIAFQPTFQKCVGMVCGGSQIHVSDRDAFRPVRTTLAILQTVIKFSQSQFQWQDPPYEYEYHKRPIDILMGNEWLADAIWNQEELDTIMGRLDQSCLEFEEWRNPALIYA